MPYKPAPGVTTRLVCLAGRVHFFYDIIADGGLGYRLQCAADGYCPPRRAAREADGRSGGAQTVQFCGIGEGDGVALAGIVVTEVAAAVIAANASLADEYPSVIAYVEEAWEGISLAVSRLFCHGSIGFVLLLITWLGAHPALVVTVYLGTDEGCCGGRELETAGL